MADDSQLHGWYRDIVASYDTVAEQYALDYFDELSRKAFDRELLVRFVGMVPRSGRVCDIGCGPGQIARFLAEHGADAMGIDISQSMVDTARRLNPGLVFERGDMLRLDYPDSTFAGITAFYSLIHIERVRVPEALAELFRVLGRGGQLLASFHAGEGEVHVDQYHGHGQQEGPKVALHVTFFGLEEMRRNIEAAGFAIEESLDREPYEFEYPSRRAYILARKPE
jgi:ubiquinone/menaquinone biosynthesis C-methylase UbiE